MKQRYITAPVADVVVNDLQICEMNSCQKCVFFEAKKKQDLFVWYVAVCFCV